MYRSIVVGTDGSPTASFAVEQAAALARVTGAPVHLVTACRPPTAGALAPESAAVIGAAMEGAREAWEAARRTLDTMAGRLRAEDVVATSHVCEGEAADVLIDVAERTKSDLIIVGSRGMHGARRFIGSVPNRVSHRAPVSVLIVRTD